MKILVTGAAGFIGNAIAKELKGSDHEVILTDILMPDELHGHAYTYADLTNQVVLLSMMTGGFASGTTLNARNGLKTAGQYAMMTLVHLGSNVFVVSGDTTL